MSLYIMFTRKLIKLLESYLPRSGIQAERKQVGQKARKYFSEFEWAKLDLKILLDLLIAKSMGLL